MKLVMYRLWDKEEREYLNPFYPTVEAALRSWWYLADSDKYRVDQFLCELSERGVYEHH